MPGHAGSPFWATVDFGSEDEDNPSTPSPSQRIYVDPWDNDTNELTTADATDSSRGNNNNSLGEPTSGSFYYVPTKNYDSDHENPLPPRQLNPSVKYCAPDYSIYGRKISRSVMPAYYHHPDMAVYDDRLDMRSRRMSTYAEAQPYEPHPLLYETIYGPVPPPPGYIAPYPRPRISLQHPEYVMAAIANGKSRKHSRMTDAYDPYAYERMSSQYEDWARPYPKAVPENFHLSRYGHLQIDYSCSWNFLDRLIRNK